MQDKKTTIELKQERNKELVIKKLGQMPIVQVACSKTGISRASYYRWRKKDKEFRKQTDKAIYKGILFINDMAESQLISSIKDKHMTGIIFWLKNRHFAYTDKIQVNANIRNKEEKLTSEQEKLIKKAMSLFDKHLQNEKE